MKYVRESQHLEIDTIELSEEEFNAANEMFQTALKSKYQTLDVSSLEYNTVVLTDGLYRVEYKIRKKS